MNTTSIIVLVISAFITFAAIISSIKLKNKRERLKTNGVQINAQIVDIVVSGPTFNSLYKPPLPCFLAIYLFEDKYGVKIWGRSYLSRHLLSSTKIGQDIVIVYDEDNAENNSALVVVDREITYAKVGITFCCTLPLIAFIVVNLLKV